MFLMNRNFDNFGKLVSKREFYCSIIFIVLKIQVATIQVDIETSELLFFQGRRN